MPDQGRNSSSSNASPSAALHGANLDAEPSAAWRADLVRGIKLIAKHASGTVSLGGNLLGFTEFLEIAARELAPSTFEALTYEQVHGIVPVRREHLGKMVRRAWIDWAETQPEPKASWLVEWDGLSEPDKEVDRQIGETLFNYATSPSDPTAISVGPSSPKTGKR